MRVGRFGFGMESPPDKNFDGLFAYAGATRFRFLSMNAAALGSVFSAPPQLETLKTASKVLEWGRLRRLLDTNGARAPLRGALKDFFNGRAPIFFILPNKLNITE